MANNNVPNKVFVRLDGQGRVIASSSVKRKNKPKVGSWMEIPAAECCDPLIVITTTTTTTEA